MEAAASLAERIGGREVSGDGGREGGGPRLIQTLRRRRSRLKFPPQSAISHSANFGGNFGDLFHLTLLKQFCGCIHLYTWGVENTKQACAVKSKADMAREVENT